MPEPDEPDRPTEPWRDAPNPDSPPQDSGSVMREYRRVMWQYSFIGIELGVAIAIGVFGGRWLDAQWGTSPWMMLVGVAIGLTAAGRDLLRLVRKATRRP